MAARPAARARLIRTFHVSDSSERPTAVATAVAGNERAENLPNLDLALEPGQITPPGPRSMAPEAQLDDQSRTDARFHFPRALPHCVRRVEKPRRRQ